MNGYDGWLSIEHEGIMQPVGMSRPKLDARYHLRACRKRTPGATESVNFISSSLEQNASKRKRVFALTPCFDASLRFLPIPSNRKTL
jgi:hypothetical protein